MARVKTQRYTKFLSNCQFPKITHQMFVIHFNKTLCTITCIRWFLPPQIRREGSCGVFSGIKNKGKKTKSSSLLPTVPKSVNKNFVVLDCYWANSASEFKSTLITIKWNNNRYQEPMGIISSKILHQNVIGDTFLNITV